MAQVTNTYETYDAVGNREELSDTIYDISPEETPFVSMIGRKKVASTHPEWQTDDLATPVTTNAQPEGDDWSFDATTPTTRVGNYTQIANKTFIISRTQEGTSKAGRKSEIARETARKGIELRTDIEAQLLSNTASSAGTGNGASNRTSGSFRAWLTSNTNKEAGGGDGGFNSGTGVVDAATDSGTQRAFTKAILDDVILSTYNNGGNPSTMMVSPYVKTVFSTFMDDANVAPFRYAASKGKKNTIIASADIYLSDFGEVAMIPNRQMARAGASVARNAFLIDSKMVSLGEFDPIKLEKPAKTGDAEKRVLITEYTLCVANEKAHGVAADLYGLSASS
jgi:hypothetical protein